MANILDLRAARQRVLHRTEPCGDADVVDLSAACGRTLAEDVETDGPWPATDRSAMDGFALGDGSGASGTELPVVGESLAGRPFDGALQPGQAIRIMTGAVVPDGARSVVPVENTSGFDGDRVTLQQDVAVGANIRPRGSESEAGVAVLTAGMRVRAEHVGVLAVLGRERVRVRRRPRVAIVATGDEVVPIDAQPLPHQVRESNSWSLCAQVEQSGGEAIRLGVAPDEAAGLRAMLERAFADADVVLTIGGISKGTHDLVHATLSELGVATEFHGIQLKPGKPTYFGTRASGERRQYVFGLPGNPASTFTVFDLLVRPMLQRWLGGDAGEWCATLPLGDVDWRANWREQAVPARLVPDATGQLRIEFDRPSPSGNPFGLLGGACYALIPPDAKREATDRLPVVGNSGGILLP